MSANNQQLDLLPLPGESWNRVPGFPQLEASTLGRIRRKDDLSIVKGVGNVLYEYERLTVADGRGVRRTIEVHRLCALAFYGAIPAGWCVDHKDGDKKNNRVENLRVVTLKENSRAALATGRCKNKLTPDAVQYIRGLLARSVEPEIIADAFGVKPAQVLNIGKRKAWAFLPDNSALEVSA